MMENVAEEMHGVSSQEALAEQKTRKEEAFREDDGC
jgi:hypothetical protein